MSDYGPTINVEIGTSKPYNIYENGKNAISAVFLGKDNIVTGITVSIIGNVSIVIKDVTFCSNKNQLEIHGYNGTNTKSFSKSFKGFPLNNTKVLVGFYEDSEKFKECLEEPDDKQPDVKKGNILSGTS